MQVNVIIYDNKASVLASFSVKQTDSASVKAKTPLDVAKLIRDVLEKRFEVEDD